MNGDFAFITMRMEAVFGASEVGNDTYESAVIRRSKAYHSE